MKQLLILITFLGFLFTLQAQIFDDFSDGDLTNNPVWLGDVDSFMVNSSFQLQLNTSVAGKSYLAAPLQFSGNDMEWRFWIRENFAPSDNNLAKFYLMADRQNLLDTGVCGYYLRFGENLSNDAVRLFRQKGNTHTLLCSATEGAIASSFNICVKVIRTVDGEWILYCSSNGSTTLNEESRCVDTTLYSVDYAGLTCQYTVGNRSNFYFDDIYCGNVYVYVDTLSPIVENVSVNQRTKKEITITFSEEVDSVSALNKMNYLIDNAVGNPDSVFFSQNNHLQIHLTYNQSFSVNIPLNLSIGNITDTTGNNMKDTVFEFILYELQIFDDFSDGDLTNNPVWLGDVDSFMVNPAFQLQLNALTAGNVYLSTLFGLFDDDMEWRFGIRENFAPSDNNLAKFYLMADRQNLLDTGLCGYYLRFGENGSNDAVRLFRQQGNTHILLCSATDGAIANSFNICVKVIRTVDGEWILYCSDNGSISLKEEARYVDTTLYPVNYAGIACQYTATNRNNFYFDDVYCGSIYVDTVPPVITNIVVNQQTKNEIIITFNEEVDSISALNKTNYLIDNNIGNPDSVYFSQGSFSQIHLIFNNLFSVNIPLTFSVSNISDLDGNIMKDTVFELFLYQSQLFDVVISEIMAKSSPVVKLPNAEYLELYNRMDYSINLNNWQLQIGNSLRTLGNVAINPGEYLIVTATANTSLFEHYGKVASVSSMQLTDGGQTVSLLDNNGETIHFVSYSDSWHDNSIKKAGGWSLEMVDTENVCEEESNWKSSQNNTGGTPGTKNSVARNNPDILAPALRLVASESEDEIRVYFTEIMIPEKLKDKHAYSLSHSLKADSVLSVGTDFRSVNLKLSGKLEYGTIYTLTLVDEFLDCAGNQIAVNSSVDFSYAVHPLANDVIINEILFNPKDDGVDFVEIYNRSDKIIDLRYLRLSTYKSDGSIDTGKLVSSIGEQLFPKQYKLLSTNSKIVQQQYDCPYPEAFIELNFFPSYNNTSGTVILLHYDHVIDLFTYNENMHYPLLRSNDGVSLERIHFDRKTQDEFNWHSAASIVGFATPGYKNSSYSENVEQTSHFEVYPEIFSPDNDGYNDLVNLSYSFPLAGYRASVSIYNVSGIKVRELVNNQLLETEGYFTWDGAIDGNIKAAVGTYIFLIQYWNLNGEVKTVKKTCTVAVKF
jgi:hypothetical protein